MLKRFIVSRTRSMTECHRWRENLALTVLSAIVSAAMLRAFLPVALAAFPQDSFASELAWQAMSMSTRDFFLASGIATLGGVANLFHELKSDEKTFTLQNGIGHMFICQFSGMLSFLAVVEMGLSAGWGLFTCGIAGWMGNAPEGEGDGWAYIGRGHIQITGRATYRAYSQASGNNVEVVPDLVASPRLAADTAGWYWHDRGCNALADAGDWVGLTRMINGGTNGLSERLALHQRAQEAIA